MRFGTWLQDTNKGANELKRLILQENEIWMDVPIGTPKSSTRRYATLFGAFQKVEHQPARRGKERTGYPVKYPNQDSALVAHRLTLESVLGEIQIIWQNHPSKLEHINKW